MELSKFNKQKNAANDVFLKSGRHLSNRRFRARYREVLKKVNLAVCKERNLSKVSEIRKLPPETKLTSSEVKKTYRNFRKFCRNAVDSLLAQD